MRAPGTVRLVRARGQLSPLQWSRLGSLSSSENAGWEWHGGLCPPSKPEPWEAWQARQPEAQASSVPVEAPGPAQVRTLAADVPTPARLP